MSDSTKLRALIRASGFDSLTEFMKVHALDSACPAICTAADCDYVCEMEPDQDEGWCELCERNTVKSALILAGFI